MLRNSSINAAVSLALLPIRPAISQIKEKNTGKAEKKKQMRSQAQMVAWIPPEGSPCAALARPALAFLIPDVTFLMDNKLRASDSILKKDSSRP